MKIITLNENNRQAQLDAPDAEIARQMKKKNPGLPFSLSENILRFAEYTVGSLNIGDTQINITTRNAAFTLDKVLQMMLYIQGVKSNLGATELGVGQSGISGISLIPALFVRSVKKLTAKGLVGGYKSRQQKDVRVRGRLLANEFNPKLFPYQGLPFEESAHSNNVIHNQIIKTALQKCLLISDDATAKEIKSLLRYFDQVSLLEPGVNLDDKSIFSFNSYNSNYPEAIRLAILVLKNVELSTNETGIQWSAFLTNSNDLFEKFVRLMTSNMIDEKVEKWDRPKEFASINYEGQYDYKSFVPDIVVGFWEETGKALAVMDAKNKYFEPEKTTVANLVDVGDLYELMFYLRQLKTSVGALIYPSSKRYSPIAVNALDQGDLNISLISIDLSATIEKMETNLRDDVLKTVLAHT